MEKLHGFRISNSGLPIMPCAGWTCAPDEKGKGFFAFLPSKVTINLPSKTATNAPCIFVDKSTSGAITVMKHECTNDGIFLLNREFREANEAVEFANKYTDDLKNMDMKRLIEKYNMKKS